MRGGNEAAKAIGVDLAVSPKMVTAVDLWAKIYRNEAPWLNDRVCSLNLGAAIASEIARITTIEMESTITGSKRAEWLNEQYQKVIDNIREPLEYGNAKGGLVMKPYISGDKIEVDFVQGDRLFPLSYNSSGYLTGAIFPDQIIRGNKIYTRLEAHELKKDVYRIRNYAFESNSSESLGKPVSLSIVEEWADLAEELELGDIQAPLFGYFRVPMANPIDEESPVGASIYARAVDLIQQADEQWSRILWEYEGSELAVDADATAFKKDSRTGEYALPKGKERLFRLMNWDVDATTRFEVFSPEIRDQSLFNGLNRILQRIEFNCGFSYGVLSDPQVVDKTAEEIKSSKQRMYSTVVDSQKALKTALEGLVYAMNVWATLGRLAPPGKVETSFYFDDSIVVDEKEKRMQMKEDVRDRIASAWEYRKEFYGEDEETAKARAAEAAKSNSDSPFFEE